MNIVNYSQINKNISIVLIKDIHNSWLYCFTNPLKLGTRVNHKLR